MRSMPIYDIFSGTCYKNAMWLEAVEGLAAAQQRMKQIAEQTPGPHFLFSVDSKAIVASIDTSEPKHEARAAKAS